jgi:hypothetical protein
VFAFPFPSLIGLPVLTNSTPPPSLLIPALRIHRYTLSGCRKDIFSKKETIASLVSGVVVPKVRLRGEAFVFCVLVFCSASWVPWVWMVKREKEHTYCCPEALPIGRYWFSALHAAPLLGLEVVIYLLCFVSVVMDYV